MKLLRLVISDLHLGTGMRRGELNPFEDFLHDDRFAEWLAHYDALGGEERAVELILNGDVFDLLKVPVGGTWPTEITADLACEKLRQCLEGHPRFVEALRQFLAKPSRSVTYLPGNHDLEMCLPATHEVFRRYVAPGAAADRVRFITSTDTYYLPEGIQIRHGHQLERIHRVDYAQITRRRRDGTEVLDLPWGTLWMLEVMLPEKAARSHVDRVLPLRRFILAALLLDTRFALRFIVRSVWYFMRWRVFLFRAWRKRLMNFSALLREEIIALGGFDEACAQALLKMRGAHTLIVGHSHGPRYLALPGGKILVNTGTWVPMIHLNLQYLGQNPGLTYALIEYGAEGKPRTTLMRWHGTQPTCEAVPYAD